MSTPLPSPLVFDATEANFQTDVLDASFQHAVLVDLWAEWCEPCKTLAPLLEKVVADYHGAVKLAKVDCEKEQALAASFGVRSLPTVVLLREGQLVDAFTGALPESGIREFLSRHVQPNPAPDGNSAGEPGADETPEQAISRLQQAMAAQPDQAEMKLDMGLAQLRAGNATAAQAELDTLPANLADDDRAKRLRTHLDLLRTANEAPSMDELTARLAQDPADLAARDLLGVRLLMQGDPVGGLEQFLDILRADRAWNDGQARKRLIAAFSVLDDQALIGTYRRKMSSLLF